MTQRLNISDGRRFTCTQCGHCCQKDGLVYISPDEIKAMAEHLGLSVKGFCDTYKVRYDSASQQPNIEAKNNLGCPLLDANNRCRVHPVKPLQCRSFPFWPDLLESQSDWDEAREHCPGMDRPDGRLYSKPEIIQIRDKGFGTDSPDLLAPTK